MNIGATVTDIKTRVESFRKGLADLIQALPDNPRITRLGSGCFTMKMSDTFAAFKTGRYKSGEEKREMMSNWCPESHDFKRQYQWIAGVLNKADIENIPRFLNSIIEDETFRGKAFHPEVIRNLKTIWEFPKGW